ncbi:MAG: hypothetical protein HYZ11_00040 [Candidatus Tectomicrobia bacterium]|uniref:Uncharacterized protein n=1 Tax=Tectimicrobiota bacterium TaxID=2528274 RepID=A0A932HY38_UNCTE|nr:hypothetical protein [Candidatus Tectomicrobia bacterium]
MAERLRAEAAQDDREFSSRPLSQVRGTGKPFHSRLVEGLAQGSARLQGLAAQMYLKGLSAPDATGEQILNKSTVSRVTESLNADFEVFKRRALLGLAMALPLPGRPLPAV